MIKIAQKKETNISPNEINYLKRKLFTYHRNEKHKQKWMYT